MKASLTRQRNRSASIDVLPREMPVGEGKLHQHFALVVADDQHGVLESPLAAGEEIAGAAARGRDRPFGGGGGSVAECHDAAAAAGKRQLPLAGEIDGWRRWRRRRLGWCRRSSGRRLIRLAAAETVSAGAGGERHQQERGGDKTCRRCAALPDAL